MEPRSLAWGAERGAGAAIALFFLACLLAAPLFAPGGAGAALAAPAHPLGRGHGDGRRADRGPWEAIQRVQATEVTTHVRGVAVSEPLVGIDISDPQAISTGPLERLLLPLNRRLAADITLPIRTLDIDPAPLYEALRYYQQHPKARDELATRDGLARLQHGQLTSPRPARH